MHERAELEILKNKNEESADDSEKDKSVYEGINIFAWLP